MRLINADALKKAFCEYCDSVESADEPIANCGRDCITLAIVDRMPTVRWIPCSERLPEKTGYYLVCDVTAEYDNIRGRQDVSKYVIGRHGGHWYGAICGKYITHWMPLPEPPESEVQDA